ncbi:MAG TPA: PAS domain-containing sensor histidine kinase [Thermoguttaceae bacterium]|nr:PAS domain-containing sensor histidine kinase [Thermoguttaceae bacterium]
MDGMNGGKEVAMPDRVARLEDEVARQRAVVEELRASEAKYRELVEDACSIVLRMDTQGNVTYANHHALEFFGFDEKGLVGKNVVGTIVPEVERSGRDMAELIRDICERPERHQNNENENVQQDGTSRWIAWTNKALCDAEGRPTEILSIGNDITARKRAEERLEQEQRTLRHMLEEQQHDQKLMAYEIHDGLAQMIAGAVAQLEVFDEARNDEPEAAAEFFKTGSDLLGQAAVEVRRLISNLRPSALEKSGVVDAIRQLIASRKEGLRPQVEFTCDVQFDRLGPLLENCLFRIVQETLHNATKYSGSDRARVSLRQQDGWVRLEIKDWGKGFDVSKAGADRFGLKGIRERARILGGKASITSAPGQGVETVVELPLMTVGSGQ